MKETVELILEEIQGRLAFYGFYESRIVTVKTTPAVVVSTDTTFYNSAIKHCIDVAKRYNWMFFITNKPNRLNCILHPKEFDL